MTQLAARVNKELPHTVAQVGLLHFLLTFLREDVALNAAVETYLDDKALQRQGASR